MTRYILATLAATALLFANPWGAEARARGGGNDAPAPQSGDTVTLAIGETKIIPAKDVKNYAEGVAGIIDIKLTSDASQFVIAGRHPGSTTLLLIKNDGTEITINVDVFLRSPQAVEHELMDLLRGLSGVQVRRVGAHIVIDGTVDGDADLKRVVHIASLYPGEVDSLVTVGAATVLGPPATAGESQPPQRFVIRIDFYFVQYDTTSTYAVGIGWPASIGGSALQGTVTYDFLLGIPKTATATITNQPLPRLDLASSNGWAKVLKHATVITNSGVEASFSNGGEQNFSVTTGLGVGIQKIPFGTEVTVLPKFDPRQRQLDVKLSAEVSDLTASASGTSLPGRTTSRLTTVVSLQLGQSLVLSGIQRESQTRTTTGIPILKDIPVLGLLFGSHADAQESTEGAILVVPSVLEQVSNSAQELVDGAIKQFHNFSGNMSGLHVYETRPPPPPPPQALPTPATP